MQAEHHLRPVAGRSIVAQGIVADKITRPLHSTRIYIDEKRGVGRHHNDVAIALKTRYPCCVPQGRAQVSGRRTFTRCPFAYKNLGPIAIVAVISVCIYKELLRRTVEVGVKDMVIIIENVRMDQRTGAAATSFRSGNFCLIAFQNWAKRASYVPDSS